MTLVELLVVLAIIGVILSISMPGLTGYAKRIRLKTTTRQLIGLLSLARSRAISSHEDHAVVVDAEQREARVVDTVSGEALEQKLRWPQAMRIDVQVGGKPAAEPHVLFRPTGGLSGRTVVLVVADRTEHLTITVIGTTGAVSVEGSVK